MKSSKKKKIRTGLFVLVLAVVAVIACLCYFYRPRTHSGEKEISISVVYQNGTKDQYTVKTHAKYLKKAAESVLDLDGKDTSQGYVILSINGKKADPNTGKVYWAIYVNGKYGQSSVDKQPVKDGDVFLFKYESY